MYFSLFIAGFLATASFALPSANPQLGYPVALSPRAACAETCGTVCYYQTTIDNAVSEGYELYQNGQTEASGKYPHTYVNLKLVVVVLRKAMRPLTRPLCSSLPLVCSPRPSYHTLSSVADVTLTLSSYNNYEGFDFPVSGPYQEFPILCDFQTYDGGSPGADRVVFNSEGQLAGVITHTGASGNDSLSAMARQD